MKQKKEKRKKIKGKEKSKTLHNKKKETGDRHVILSVMQSCLSHQPNHPQWLPSELQKVTQTK